MKRTYLMAIVTTLICVSGLFIIGESCVRLVGQQINGQFSVPLFGRTVIPPYKIDAISISQNIKRYQETDNTIFVYDRDLGWTYRPAYASSDSKLIHNKDGIRTAAVNKDFKKVRLPGFLRIEIFGDSFSHGDGVPFSQTWGNLLEINLNNLNIQTEILNFGVGGYGMGQAYLRYNKVGKHYSPSIVIFGFAFENILRNVNIFRNIYKRSPDGIIFSKPRFRIVDRGLEVVNAPTILPDEISYVLSNLNKSELKDYEYFYDENFFSPRWWHVSKFISLAAALFERYRMLKELHTVDGDLTELAMTIIKEFKSTVEHQGGSFLIVHLPPGNHFKRYIDSGQFKYDKLLKKLEEIAPVIRPERGMAEATLTSAESLYTDHYSWKGHKVIADEISSYLIRELRLR